MIVDLLLLLLGVACALGAMVLFFVAFLFLKAVFTPDCNAEVKVLEDLIYYADQLKAMFKK